jgi:hypothetical protein
MENAPKGQEVSVGDIEETETDFTFIPLHFDSGDPGNPRNFAKFFEGPLPKPGDIVGLYCYKASDTAAEFRYTVIGGRTLPRKGEESL